MGLGLIHAAIAFLMVNSVNALTTSSSTNATCTAEQRKAVMRMTPEGAQHVALIQECRFSRSCIAKRASGRLRNLLARASSQESEDLHLYFQFFDAPAYNATGASAARGGLYVELGALDGKHLSNSVFYQNALGWGGVLIEAALQNYMLLSKNVALGVRRNVSVVHAAACPEPTILQLPLPSGYFSEGHDVFNGRKNRGASGRATNATSTMMMYTAKNGLVHQLSLASVLCVPMRTILEGASHTARARGIDLFSVDVEGHELNVVDSHDWQRLPAKVVIIEMNKKTTPPAVQAQIRSVLREKASLCYFGKSGHANEVWVDPEFERKIA